MTSHAGTINALPDAELTAILERLRPKPGEQRVLMLRDGALDMYMPPESAKEFQAMMARIEALIIEHGQEAALAIYDASMAAAYTHKGTLQ